jgi:hypothetical protein
MTVVNGQMIGLGLQLAWAGASQGYRLARCVGRRCPERRVAWFRRELGRIRAVGGGSG